MLPLHLCCCHAPTSYSECILNVLPPFVHTNCLFVSSAKGVHTREKITGNTFPETIIRLASPAPPPPSQCWEMNLPGGNHPEKNRSFQHWDGGQWGGDLGRGSKGLEIRGLWIRFLKWFPVNSSRVWTPKCASIHFIQHGGCQRLLQTATRKAHSRYGATKTKTLTNTTPEHHGANKLVKNTVGKWRGTWQP